MKDLISIVIPIYNEEESIPKLISNLQNEINKLKNYNFEIVLVENGSYDSSLDLLISARKKDKRLKVLQLAKNFGCDGGIVAGLTFAQGEAAIVMMADLQEDPKLISVFLKKWKEGYDVVYGIVKERKGTNTTRKIGTYLFYKLMNILTYNFITPDVSDFRLLDKKVYSVVIEMPEHNKFFRGVVSWTGFKQIGIPFTRAKRVAGDSKANFKTVFGVAMNGIFSFSDVPLIIPFMLGTISVVSTLLLLVLKIYEASLVLFLFSIVMFMFYVQNEYLKRVVEEVRNRPNFIVKNTYGLEAKNI